jgi:hypothetical protein
MNYQKLIIVGNATKDAQPRQSKSGEKTFTTFDVGVSDGKDKTTYFPVVVFGKQSEAMALCLTHGTAMTMGRCGSHYANTRSRGWSVEANVCPRRHGQFAAEGIDHFRCNIACSAAMKLSMICCFCSAVRFASFNIS